MPLPANPHHLHGDDDEIDDDDDDDDDKITDQGCNCHMCYIRSIHGVKRYKFRNKIEAFIGIKFILK